MMEVRVNENLHKCGTVHCLGGWYAISTLDTNKDLDYSDGANRMAKDLGFNRKIDFKFWAKYNRDIWGNKYGINIFSDESAFESNTRPDGAKTLQDIIDHLTEVQSRL